MQYVICLTYMLSNICQFYKAVTSRLMSYIQNGLHGQNVTTVIMDNRYEMAFLPPFL